MMSEDIAAIDIFAGPGGLAEGFSNARFDIRLSIEMDEHAHETLRFRIFCRKLLAQGDRDALLDFYSKLADNTQVQTNELSDQYPEIWKKADKEAFRATLGETSSKTVSGRIEAALGNAKDWILLGGPPCQAYSIVGRSRMQNAEDYRLKRGHDFGDDYRHQLYKEYLRIVAVHAPSIFVMENVKGLLSSKHKGAPILEQIKKDLQAPRKATRSKPRRLVCQELEYELYPLWEPTSKDLPKNANNHDFIVEAEQQGVPQARHRLFIIGLRKDLRLRMQHLEKAKETLTTWDVLKGLPKLHSTLSKQKEIGWLNFIWKFPNSEAGYWTRKNQPDVFREIVHSLEKIFIHKDPGGLAVRKEGTHTLPKLYEWYRSEDMPVALNHESRGHMPSDLHRYLYSSAFAAAHGYSPKLRNFPPSLLPAHKNVNKQTGEAIFDDRFRTQCKEKPSTTITSHIHKDGHYFIHPDPAQCRSLTVREAARLQTFPDDYFFCGPRTEQFKQVGNAVPPYLAYQIGETVKTILNQK